LAWGPRLRPIQIFYGSVILIGIGISLSPGKTPRSLAGRIFFRAFCSVWWPHSAMVFGAVLSRKAYAVLNTRGDHIDGVTAAFSTDHRRAAGRGNLPGNRQVALRGARCHTALAREMAQGIAVGHRQQPGRANAWRELLSMGISNHSRRHRLANRSHDPAGSHADHPDNGKRKG